MFTLKQPCVVSNVHRTEREILTDTGRYATLDEAIHAALDADLDLEAAMIEKRGVLQSVNEWISVHIAGGDLSAG